MEEKQKRKKKDRSMSYVLFGIPQDRGSALGDTVQDAMDDNFPDSKRDEPLDVQWRDMYAKVMSISKDEAEQKWLHICFGTVMTQFKDNKHPLETLIKKLLRGLEK